MNNENKVNLEIINNEIIIRGEKEYKQTGCKVKLSTLKNKKIDLTTLNDMTLKEVIKCFNNNDIEFKKVEFI